jgi:hypothetical protein
MVLLQEVYFRKDVKMKIKELVLRVIIAFFVIAIAWFVYTVSDYIHEGLLQIKINDLNIITFKSVLLGALLSVPFGLLKYYNLKKRKQ